MRGQSRIEHLEASSKEPATGRQEHSNGKHKSQQATRKKMLLLSSAELDSRQILLRGRRLTWCLFCLISALSCLMPFLSLHLTQRIGLLIFESDLLQLRSSLISVIISLFVLVTLNAIIGLMRRQRQANSMAIGEETKHHHHHHHEQHTTSTHLLQKLLCRLIGLFAIVSVVSYLSLALVVPHVRQIQRAPIASFDCQANQITIENCPQQFASSGGQQSLLEAISQLLGGDLNGNSERLIKKLNCLKYNHRELNKLQVPTRFLLHKCGLVCRPQRQQLHQFGDDLNRDLSQAHHLNQPTRADGPTVLATPDSASQDQHQHQHHQQAGRPRLVAPYSPELATPAHGITSEPANPFGSTYHAHQLNQDEQDGPDRQPEQQVLLKICFSGESTETGSSYKRFCIENLSQAASGDHQHQNRNHHQQDQSLTVGQLNAMLRRLESPDRGAAEPAARSHRSSHQLGPMTHEDQSTNYVNPIVQFEAHFKNWPHLSRTPPMMTFANNELPFASVGEAPFGPDSHYSVHDQVVPTTSSNGGANEEEAWCKFKPIPPFIVNNKPFSEIQCSLEHEYTMTTGPASSAAATAAAAAAASSSAAGERIYLKRSTHSTTVSKNEEAIGTGKSATNEAALSRERCNIQCKVNILYQIHLGAHNNNNNRRTNNDNLQNHHNHHHQELPFSGARFNQFEGPPVENSYYLPLKPCLIVTGNGDKAKTSSYYLVFRSLADSSLLIAFIFVDLLLLIESIDTKQFQLEAKKLRLFSLLLAFTLMPLLVALLFDLAAAWLPNYVTKSRPNGYLITLINERLIPSLSNFFDQLGAWFLAAGDSSNKHHQQHHRPSSHTAPAPVPVPAAPTTTTDPKQNSPSSISTNLADELQPIDQQQHYSSRSSSGRQQQLTVDNYLVPFFIYAIFMFVLAINSFKLPLVTRSAPLLRVASTEELGMVSKAGRRMTANNTSLHQQEPSGGVTSNKRPIETSLDLKEALKVDLNLEQAHNGTMSLSGQQSLKVSLFALLVLFMGLQFNLSQLTQTQVLIDSFGTKSDLIESSVNAVRHQPRAAFWFALTTHPIGAIFILALALLFSDEMSAFMADFSPFKQISDHDKLSKRQRETNFIKIISISLLAYSLRYFALANMTQLSPLKWPLIFLFQITELLNFPLTWFALTARAHELIAEHPDFHRAQKESLTGEGSKALNGHILIQSSLAFVYFALARFVALFVHSLHASLHLHSDDVDWFITSFYGKSANLLGQNQSQKVHVATPAPVAGPAGNLGNQTQASQVAPEALFSPLPNERQTYLHASRLFIKYNSFVCLLFGLGLLVAFIYAKYQLWTEQKRVQLEHEQARQAQLASSDGRSQLIDERLSMDLMRMHSDLPRQRTIWPKRPPSSAGQHEQRQSTSQEHVVDHDEHHNDLDLDLDLDRDDDDDDGAPPRARIHFRYDLGRSRYDDSSSSSSSSAERTTPTTTTKSTPAHLASSRQVPIGRDDEMLTSQTQKGPARAPPAPSERVERITRIRSKRVRIVDDGENWSVLDRDQHEDEEQHERQHQHQHQQVAGSLAEVSPPPAEFADPPQVVVKQSTSQLHNWRAPNIVQQQQQRNRRITFAPTTTLIGHQHNRTATGTSSSHSTGQTSSGRARQASPERSIGSDLDDDEKEVEARDRSQVDDSIDEDD